jgi:hypothetical protein
VNFLPIYTYFIALCFLVSLSVFIIPERNYFYLKIFSPFLLVTFIAEIIGSYWASIGRNNLAFYNFFSTFEFCFSLFFIALLITSKRVKKIILAITFLYALAAIVNIIFIQKMRSFHSATYSIGCLLVVAFCIYYFFELFRFPKSEKLQFNPGFWICTGLLFYYCCGFPLFGLANLWIQHTELLSNTFSKISSLINIFLYSLFTISFLCIRTRRYTL